MIYKKESEYLQNTIKVTFQYQSVWNLQTLGYNV